MSKKLLLTRRFSSGVSVCFLEKGPNLRDVLFESALIEYRVARQ
jgi:hypothetical protein